MPSEVALVYFFWLGIFFIVLCKDIYIYNTGNQVVRFV